MEQNIHFKLLKSIALCKRYKDVNIAFKVEQCSTKSFTNCLQHISNIVTIVNLEEKERTFMLLTHLNIMQSFTKQGKKTSFELECLLTKEDHVIN